MKIIHLISGGDTGGAKTHVHSLLYNLTKLADITMVCFMDGPFAREAAQMGIPTVVIPGNNIPAALKRLRALVAERGCDLIHCHGSRGNLMGALLAWGTGLPVVTTIHSDYKLDYLGRPLAALTYGSLNAWALRRIKYRVGVSDAMVRLLISRGFSPNTTFSIYNGIDFDRAAAKFEPAAFYGRIGADIAPGDVVVGAAARLDPVKDLSTLIRGFARARERVPGLKLIIAGEGPEKESLRALALSLGVGDGVFFAGWVSDMDEFYESIHINALTSISETFPYAITEGAFHSLPTVSSRVGGIPALIKNGETGCLFTAGDDGALGRCLAELAGDGRLRRRLGDAIHRAAAAEFSMAATCREQLGIYERILRREALGPGERDGVLICGAYGHGNAGDEAILEAIIGELRSIDPDMPLTVLSRTPGATMLRDGIDAIHSFNLPAMRRVMRRSRLYINGGGSLIQDVTSRRSLYYYLYTLSAAKRLGCRVLMYGCGIGPVLYDRDIERTGRVLNSSVDAITLREPDSLEELRRFGVTKPEIVLTSDPALTLGAASPEAVDQALAAAGVDPGGRYICFALREWPGFEEKTGVLADAGMYAYERHGLTPLFLSINHKSDDQAAAAVAGGMSCPHAQLPGPLTTELTIGVLSRMEALISMRLHGLIFAAGQGVPLIGVSYDPKVTAFLRCVEGSGCARLDEITAEGLRALIDAALAGRGVGDAAAAVERLRERERGNVEMARRLLGKDVEETI